MTGQFQLLLTLQRIDGELKTLKDKLTGVPVRVQELRRSAADLKSGLEATRKDILEHRKQYKLAEVELKGAEEKAGTYSVQLYSAKTNEQYKAFLKEIETQKRLSSGIEDRMIVLMEELEQLERKAASAQKEAGEVDAEVAGKIKLVEQEQREIETGIAEREEQRARVVAELPPELLKRYDRVRANKGGIAVATTKAGRCSGCLSPVPAQKLLEIDLRNKLHLCEACGRILVPPE